MQQRGHSPGFILISGPRNVTQVAYLIFKRSENPHFSDSYVNIVTDGPKRSVRVCMRYDDEKPV